MEDIRIFAEKKDAEITYKKIRSEIFTKKYFNNTSEIFTMALLIGKYIINKKQPLESKKDIIRVESIDNKNEMDILKTIAIEETEDVTILSDTKKIFEICEEYANAGIKELNKWVVNEQTFQTKLAENLIKFYNENEKILSNYMNK